MQDNILDFDPQTYKWRARTRRALIIADFVSGRPPKE